MVVTVTVGVLDIIELLGGIELIGLLEILAFVCEDVGLEVTRGDEAIPILV